jgi:molybdopterin molybdotransferase
MISVQEALRAVLQYPWKAPVHEVAIQEATGRILAEDIAADRDFPPFDRVTMDGIAFNRAHFGAEGAGLTLAIEATHFAGNVPIALHDSVQCIEVMTGAVMPLGTDTVVRYEDIEISTIDGKRCAAIKVPLPTTGHNVHHQGTDRRAGEVLIKMGTLMSPAEVGVAASVGKATLRVKQMPRVAVVSTGDELVDVHQTPELHQIRRSNSYMLMSALQQRGVQVSLYHLLDDKDAIRQKVASLLHDYDALILNGGVSEGKADFVPLVLAELGVEKRFHKVAQRPGKPFWFGRSAQGKAVFALPGNPVSTFVCCYQYILPWLDASFAPIQVAALGQDIWFAPPLSYFVPVQISFDSQGQRTALPLKGSGSGDFANLLTCDGFVVLPPEGHHFEKGSVFPFIPFR